MKCAHLLPIKHPLFNLREVCKQCALLEDHLNSEGKQCVDCIRKHFLTIEGLFEEAVSLDAHNQWSDLIGGKADLIRQLEALWIDTRYPGVIAQGLRQIRKELTPECFDLRLMTGERTASRVADRWVQRGVHICGSKG
jgi:hypothetical protein